MSALALVRFARAVLAILRTSDLGDARVVQLIRDAANEEDLL